MNRNSIEKMLGQFSNGNLMVKNILLMLFGALENWLSIMMYFQSKIGWLKIWLRPV
jgi:hypothetical protein